MRFNEIIFKQMLKVSAFCFEEQTSFISKKKYIGRSKYQGKSALFNDPIFSEGFGLNRLLLNLES